MGKWVHRLSEVDLDAMTAVCAVDGPVSIYVYGSHRRCGVANNQTTPNEPTEASKKHHRMLSKNEATMTGVCSICGPVKVRWKRGCLRCANKLTEQRPESLKIKQELK